MSRGRRLTGNERRENDMKRGSRFTQSFLCLLVIVPVFWAGTALGATFNVPADYPNIQAAIDAAANSKDTVVTVQVADGTYTGPENVNLLIQGRSINIEGSGPDSCIIDCQGSGRAFTFKGVETNESVLSGFTIKGGNVTDNGGGILCDNASPTIKNCIITGNQAKYGGGIACLNSSNSSPAISNCDIEENTSINGGGGLYCSSSSPQIKECSISNNVGGYYGAGVYLTASSPSLSSCLIVRNSATYYGGGVWCSNSSSPIITNCTIADNLLTDPTYGRGGAMYSNKSSSQVTNSILWKNAATSGPEIYLASSSALHVEYSDVQGGKAAVIIDNSTLDWDDATNIDADPLFVGEEDYHLTPGSPCIDAGIDNGDLPDVDFEGDPRILNGKPDIGADEAKTEVTVSIDIKPGSRHKEIDLRDKGVVPVAVLGSKDFDARMIDPKTVLFAGAAPVRHAVLDVDRDYDLDMLFFFKIRQLNLDEDSTEATLTGKTVDGVSFKGTGSVTIYKPKSKAESGWKWARIAHMFNKHTHYRSRYRNCYCSR
jgi:hypothetical protein